MRSYLLPEGDGLIEGKLKIGSPMQTMVIKETKKYVSDNSQIVLFDAPPGTSCPVVETITECDYVILVTEPTPFGLHDMKLMVELLNELEKPFGIIVNKAGLGDNETHQYIEKEGFELLGEIPFMKSYASDYANGNLFKNIPPEIEKTYNNITKKIVSKMNLK
jgi:MinD superfamily P-loop ATPase